MNLYPLLMAPAFRHGEDTPWGGHMLRDTLMKDAPEGATGESLEVSAIPEHESVVSNGPHAGQSLSHIAELWGEALTGDAGGEFPLLLKLLDTQTPLSVQVHPGDAYAAAHGLGAGKTKAWIILNAEPGAQIVYGVDTRGEPLERIVAENRLGDALRRRTVRPGDVYYIPDGMLYALCDGILCYEIQRSNDATYRLWDWDRVDSAGNARELHVENALEVCKPDLDLSMIEGTTVLCKGGSRTYYVSDTHFELCRLNLSGVMPLESGRMRLLTTMGPCALRWPEGETALNPFDSVVVPAALEGVSLEGNTKALMSCLPDRPRLIEALGYRAENVAGLLDQ